MPFGSVITEGSKAIASHCSESMREARYQRLLALNPTGDARKASQLAEKISRKIVITEAAFLREILSLSPADPHQSSSSSHNTTTSSTPPPPPSRPVFSFMKKKVSSLASQVSTLVRGEEQEEHLQQILDLTLEAILKAYSSGTKEEGKRSVLEIVYHKKMVSSTATSSSSMGKVLDIEKTLAALEMRAAVTDEEFAVEVSTRAAHLLSKAFPKARDRAIAKKKKSAATTTSVNTTSTSTTTSSPLALALAPAVAPVAVGASSSDGQITIDSAVLQNLLQEMAEMKQRITVLEEEKKMKKKP